MSGLRASHLLEAIEAQSDAHPELLRMSTQLINVLAQGEIDCSLAPWICGNRLIPLRKPDDGIRPIGVPEVWFRLVARCLVHKAKNRVKTYLGSIQLGVGVPTATESIIHKISSIISVWDDDTPTRLLQLDVRNAFNSISRQSIWEQVHVVIPDLERWFLWAYGQPAPMFPDEAVDHVIWATAGVIQGDPLGPLFFALGQQKVLLQIQGLLPEFSIWYLDDGVLVASEAWLQSHWAQICEAYRMIGLEDPKKCLLFGGTATCNTLNLPQHPLTAGIVLLGTPLGSASHIDATLNNHYLRLEGLLRLLPNLRCKQVEFGILRYCLGPSKILHLLRTLAPAALCAQVDQLLFCTLATLVGGPIPPAAWDLATLPVRRGGLGLVRAADIQAPARLP